MKFRIFPFGKYEVWIDFLFCLFLITFIHECMSQENPNRTDVRQTCPEKALIKYLMTGYVNYTRPIVDYITPKKIYGNDQVAYQLVVEFGISLLQILGLKEMDQILSTSVRLLYKWTDVLLRWDPADYKNVTDIRIPAEKVWLPDILLYNYADERLEEVRETDVTISYDGIVKWSPLAIYKSTCQVKTEYFPYDEQKCHLKFGTWSYDGYRLNMTFINNTSRLIIDELVPSPEWHLAKSYAKFNEKLYTCCPEPFSDITYTLIMSRQSSFYTYILILPCFLLNWLTLVLFWLPPESPAKLVLGMNMFVAFFLLLLILEEYVPSSSNDFPLIGTYYCVNMIIITMSMFLCLITVNFHFRGDIRKEVPIWIKKFANHPAMSWMGAQVPEYKDENQKMESIIETQFRMAQENTRSKKMKERFLPQQPNGPDSSQCSCCLSTSSFENQSEIYAETSMDEYEETSDTIDHNIKFAKRWNIRYTMNKQYQTRLTRINLDLRHMLRSVEWLSVMQQQDIKISRINEEWRSVAVLFDRIFFWLSMLSILICMTLFYPRAASAASLEQDDE